MCACLPGMTAGVEGLTGKPIGHTGRVGCLALACAALGGCWGFGIPVKEDTRVNRQAESSVTIRIGESTRVDVRAALGEPWLRSDFWRAELYRADDKRMEVEFIGVIIYPVPIGVFSEKVHGYVLVTYDTADRVSQLSAGSVHEGLIATNEDKWLMLRADDVTFAIDVGRAKPRPALVADSTRLREYLAGREHAASCTLVAACTEDAGCPDEVAIDAGKPFNPSPVTVLCALAGPCPAGTRTPGYEVNGKGFVNVPVLHVISVPPGPHRLVITSSVLDGRGEESFECAAGQILYGSVRSRVEGASWWSSGKLQATVTFAAATPESRDGQSIVLYRNGQWLEEGL